MHIHHQNVHDHIGNVFCVVVPNVHILIFQGQNKTITIQMLAQSYYFMYINAEHFVLFIADTLSMKRNSANCVRLLQMQLLLQNFIPEKSLS